MNDRVGSWGRAERALEAVRSSEAAAVLNDPRNEEALVALSGASEWATRVLIANPTWLDRLTSDSLHEEGQSWRPEPRSNGYYTSRASEIVERVEGDTSAFESSIRTFRIVESLRIALMELWDAEIRVTYKELSLLAASVLQAALDHHYPILVAAHGKLQPECRHLVLGLGKLGGCELNFSSDIDVIYVYEDDAPRAGEMSSHEFHRRLFERVTRSLSSVSEFGRAYRVDIDLRPEGRTGPLCNSLEGLERYYETWGRTWERAAWIKAQPVAGHLELFEDIKRFSRPFVFRRTRDIGAVREIVEMKGKIDSDHTRIRKNRGSLDLKLGSGGIREVEFIVQAHQLLYGGHNPALRVSGTLSALRALESAGWISILDREALSRHYQFLRRVEHRVQLLDDRQTHVLPKGQHGEEVARTLGFRDLTSLEHAVSEAMAWIHGKFRGLLGAVDQEASIDSEVLALLDATEEKEAKVRLLQSLGSASPNSALTSIESACRHPQSPLHPGASESRAVVGKRLLAELLKSSDIDRALSFLPSLIRPLLFHEAFLEPFRQEDIRRGVARVLGASDFLARILVSSPEHSAEVLLSSPLASGANLRERAEACFEAADIEKSIGRFRTLKQTLLMTTAVAEMANAITYREVQVTCTELAVIMVDLCLRLATTEAEHRYGRPQDDKAALVILGGGSMGAQEQGYFSDLDISALFGGHGQTVGGTRGSVSLREYYTRIFQRTLSFLTVKLPQGELYRVDLRLRPSGSQGSLITNIENFLRYHESGRARLWERQALLRTRVIAGDASFFDAGSKAIEDAAYNASFPPDGRAEIARMRQRLFEESHLKTKRSVSRVRNGKRLFHIKRDQGGLVEAEFLLQAILLEYGVDDRSLRVPNTGLALRAVARAGLLSGEDSEGLAESHRSLRRLLDWVRVLHDAPLEVVDLGERSLRALVRVLGERGEHAEASLAAEIDAHRHRVRALYEAWFHQRNTGCH